MVYRCAQAFERQPLPPSGQMRWDLTVKGSSDILAWYSTHTPGQPDWGHRCKGPCLVIFMIRWPKVMLKPAEKILAP